MSNRFLFRYYSVLNIIYSIFSFQITLKFFSLLHFDVSVREIDSVIILLLLSIYIISLFGLSDFVSILTLKYFIELKFDRVYRLKTLLKCNPRFNARILHFSLLLHKLLPYKK